MARKRNLKGRDVKGTKNTDELSDDQVNRQPKLQDITNMVKEVKPIIKEKVDKLLCTFHELPTWAQDNIYIHTGYRVPTDSYKKCLHSLIYLHNETGNVYSHLLGCVAFLALGILASFYLYSTHTASWSDYFVIYAFIATTMLCLFCSTLFHLFTCHSESHSKAWTKCDYIGIVFMIVGSYIPTINFAFYCEDIWKIVYISAVIILGISAVHVAMSEDIGKPQNIFHRVGLFMSLGVLGIIPITHSIIKGGFDHSLNSLSLSWIVYMGLIYFTGAFAYGFRIPEKWYPGKFDFWGHSHQIWHLCVLGGQMFHFVGVLKAFQFYHSGLHTCDI